MTQVNEEEILHQSDTLLKVIRKNRSVTAILKDVSFISADYSSLHISEHSAVSTLSEESQYFI